jgi:hypothetical protein
VIGGHLTRFPVDWILESRRLEEIVVRYCVWTLIPLEYYVVTRLSGGGPAKDLASAATAVACVAAVVAFVFVFSAVIALVYRRAGPTFEERLRRSSVAMIVTWSVTLALLSLSYSIPAPVGQPRDVVAELVCNLLPCPSRAGLHWPAVIIYFVWAVIAIALVVAASRVWRPRYAAPRGDARNSNIFVVAGVNAVLMAGVHAAAFLIMKPAHAASEAATHGTAFVIGPLTAAGAAVQDATFVIRPSLAFSGAALPDAAFLKKPALTISIAPP